MHRSVCRLALEHLEGESHDNLPPLQVSLTWRHSNQMETKNFFRVCQPNTASLANFFTEDNLDSLAGTGRVDPRATLPDTSRLLHDCSNYIKEAANESICISEHVIERDCGIITENTRREHIQPQSEVTSPRSHITLAPRSIS